MQNKTLDLTFVQFCNENAEISLRNRRANAYLESKQGKLEKLWNKVMKIAVSLALISSVVALCVVSYVHYEVFGTLF